MRTRLRASKNTEKAQNRNILQNQTKKPHTENPKTETFLEKQTNFLFWWLVKCDRFLVILLISELPINWLIGVV